MSNFDSQHTESIIFIDIGNSSVKTGFKKENKWNIRSHEAAQEAAFEVNNYAYPIKKIIISSVREQVKDVIVREIESHLVQEITIKSIDPALLDYETPETLGIDRFLGCLGAKRYTDKAVVVIDAGSACTIDYMNERGVYQGGVIMPGLSSILNIFKQTAPELPTIETHFPKHFPGKTTKESLELGQVVFFVDGINTMLDRYSSKFGEYELFITGGDADLVNELIGKDGIVKKELIFDGMEQILLANNE